MIRKFILSIGLLSYGWLHADIIEVASATQMLEQIIVDDSAKIIHPKVAFVGIDLDLFLGTYADPMVSEAAYLLAYQQAKVNPQGVYEEFRKHQSGPLAGPKTLVYELFTTVRNQRGSEFVVQDPRIIDLIGEVKRLGYTVKVFTAREEERQKSITLVHLKASGLDQHFGEADIVFCGLNRKTEVVSKEMFAGDFTHLYYGDDSEKTIKSFAQNEKIPTKKLFWLNDAAKAYPKVWKDFEPYSSLFACTDFIEKLIAMIPIVD